MPRTGKNNERTERAPRGDRKLIKVEPLCLRVKNLDKNYNNPAKFPSENPYPVLRIHKDGTVLYANKASEPLLKARDSALGKPAPEEWHRLAKEVLVSGCVAGAEAKDDGRVFSLRVVPIAESDYVNFYGTDITEQKKAEDALRESESRFRTLFEETIDGLLLADLETCKFHMANQQICRMLGYTADELKLLAISNIHPAESLPQVMKAVEAQAKGDTQTATEIPVRRKDGSIFYADISSKPVWMHGRQYLLGIFRDATERRKAEQAMQESNDRYHSLFESSLEGIGLSKGNQVIDANPALLNIFGYGNLEEFKKIPLLEHVAPESRSFIEERQRKFQRGEPVKNRFEYRIIRKDGQTRDLEISVKHIRIANDVYAISTFRDITEHKRAEEALRETREQVQAIIDNTPSLVYIKDIEGRLRLVNRKFESLFGMSNKELVGKTSHDLMSKEVADTHRAADLEAMAKQAGVSVEEVNDEPDGRHTYLSTKFPLFDAAGKIYGVCGISTDITERKRVEETRFETLARFSGFAEASQYGMGMADMDGHIVYVNSTLVRMLGEKSAHDCMGRHFPTAYYPQLMARRLQEEVMPALIRDGHWHGELELLTVDGRSLPTDENYFVIRDEQGQPRYLADILTDITERKQVEESMRESEEHFRTLFNAITDAIFVHEFREDGTLSNFLEVNDVACDRLGYTRQELLKMSPLDIDAPDSGIDIRPFVQRVKTGEGVTFEQIHVAKDGQRIPVEIHSRLFKLDSRNVILSLVRDITKNKKSEEAILRLNKILTMIADISQHILQTQNKDPLLKKICDVIVKYAYRMVWIGFCDENSKTIVPQAQAGFAEGYLASIKVTFDDTEYGMGPSGMAVKTTKPNVMRFIATDPRFEPWRAEAVKRGYRSSAAIPIFGENKVVGVLNVYADTEDTFGPEEIQLLEGLASDISTGLRGIDEQTKRCQTEQKLLDYQKRLKQLASQLTLVEEQERRRIAGQLHDEVSQILAMAKIKLDTLRNSPPSETSAAVLEEINSSIKKVIQETRTLTFELSNPILYELGFEAAVAEWLNDNVQVKHGIATEFHDDELPKPLDDDLKAMLFRNTRELLTNCIKHAKAGRIMVGLRRIDDSIEVTVEDNGVGFDPVQVRTKKPHTDCSVSVKTWKIQGDVSKLTQNQAPAAKP